MATAMNVIEWEEMRPEGLRHTAIFKINRTIRAAATRRSSVADIKFANCDRCQPEPHILHAINVFF